jgi:hypothetical protein
MKKLFFFLAIACISIVNGQNDTLLYIGFDSIATDAQQNVAVLPTNELDLAGWGNITWLGSEIKTDLKDLTSSWFENDLWKKWHKIPYIQAIDTNGAVFDTTVSVGLRSFSWFENEDQALSVLLSPPVWISDNMAKLKWKSMPIQGPRYQDGYKVYILNGNNFNVTTLDPTNYSPSFIMKEMDNSTVVPATTDSSLAKIYSENGFIPLAGEMHTRYTLPDSSGTGLVDSSRQHSFMQEFEIDLSGYSGNIQILFFHDSNDDNGIIIDDIFVTGNGALSTNNLIRKPIVSFPNPADNKITFDIKSATNYQQIKVYSITGKLVLIKKNVVSNNGQITIDINNLSSGIYQVEILDESRKYVGKFSKR